MRTKLGQIAVVGFLVLAWAGAASAFEVCFGLSNFGSKFKVEVTTHGNFMQLTGSERAFSDRSITGTAYSGSGGTFRVGMLQISAASGTDIIWDASLSGTTLSGPYTGFRAAFDDTITGTMSVISCSGVLSADSLADPTVR